MKKILYFNTSVGSKNLGDYVIGQSIHYEMAPFEKDAFICELPTHTKTFGRIKKIFAQRAVEEFKTFDFKFVCGTNLLYKNMVRPNPNWDINLCDCKIQKNSILVGVGSGENSKTVNRYTACLWKRVLSKDYFHSVRDEKTKQMAEALGFKAINTGCPTTWRLTEAFCSDIPAKKAEGVVFTLTAYKPDYETDRTMVEILKKNYNKLYFFPQCYEDIEYLVSLKIDSTDIKIIGGNLQAYDDLLKGNDVDYIGNRLHGGIYALQHKKRSIIVGIDYRAKNMIGNFNYYIERSDIADKLEDLINNENRTSSIAREKEIAIWKNQFLF